MTKPTTTTHPEVNNWPLWRVCLKELRGLPAYGYGLQLETVWFEERLGCKRESTEFAFAMLDLRQEIEAKDGYYLHSQTIQHEESGIRKEVWQIPSGSDHQERIAKQFRDRMKTYGEREAHILKMTLANPAANLSEAEAARAENKLRIASLRVLFHRREKTALAALEKYAPKLLKS